MPVSPAPNALSSPWHPGEVKLQRLVGSHVKMAAVGPKVIRPYMPAQHRAFFEELPFIVLGSVDAQGRPWATLRAGPPGFMHSPDDTHIQIDAAADAGDPALFELAGSVGMLGIQPHTRRRNRANGVVRSEPGEALNVEVTQSFGNCPRFITRREAIFDPVEGVPPQSEPFDQLDDEARAVIAAADTFFVASYVRHPDGATDVDVSHRGGPRGFVRVDDRGTLVIPDFAGNNFFNTLGNFVTNPFTGILFVDFERRDTLQLTGRVRLELDVSTDDAARHWRVAPSAIVRRRNSVPLQWRS